ncbi:MAG: selenocysteine-specific translation elongation factor [Planctomycetales bacterium]
MKTDLILGTAGHIDHGKTSLVKALTGVDADRLPEEKKRGITIELGFAELELGDFRLGIVDVPGHERFVRNMLAGATGIDLALLVVAADDSVKQQTREHLEILRLLGIPLGVIALTKCDAADEDWIDLVEDEVRDLVADSFLADAPIVRTSAHTGAGLDELRDALAQVAEHAAGLPSQRRVDGPFRMAIDRTFTIAGYGTVVTGSVSSGQAKLGDELSLEPGGRKVRVRGLQNHDRVVEEARRGQRAAINLAGVHHHEILRGQELASPGHLVPSKLITVQLALLPSAPRPLKNRATARVHLGTAEFLASVVLLDRDRLEAGTSAVAQLFLKEPAAAVWGQPLVLRSESPVLTIGGGKILNPAASKMRRREEIDLQQAGQLASDDPLARASAALYFVALAPWKPVDLARMAGVDGVEEIVADLLKTGELQEFKVSPTRVIRVNRLALDRQFQGIEKALAKLHDEFPLLPILDKARLISRYGHMEDALLNGLLKAMFKAKRVELTDRGIALAGRGPKLSNNERKLLTEIIAMFETAALQPPTVEEIRGRVTKNQSSVPQLVALAGAQGDLVRVNDDFYLHEASEKKMRDLLTERLADGQGLTMSQVREILGTTRKYAVPFCEYLDQQGVTKREGDLRFLAQP